MACLAPDLFHRLYSSRYSLHTPTVFCVGAPPRLLPRHEVTTSHQPPEPEPRPPLAPGAADTLSLAPVSTAYVPLISDFIAIPPLLSIPTLPF